MCECSDIGCATPLGVSVGYYEVARDDSRTFIVAAGHNDPDIETVIEDHGDYLLVQKIGAAADEAQQTDPRL